MTDEEEIERWMRSDEKKDRIHAYVDEQWRNVRISNLIGRAVSEEVFQRLCEKTIDKGS